ncbi:MAG: RHS repeat-associated core domain-containing protein, partial [Chloroflexota bacterium]
LNGNQTRSSLSVTTSYNGQDQPVSMTPYGGRPVPLTYSDGGEATRTGNGQASYQYDQTGLPSWVPPAQSRIYLTNGPDGSVISERTGGGTYYYLYDGLGSVVALTDSSGAIVNSYSYDPYGNIVGTAQERVANPVRYTGAIWDAATGLYKMGERYYDPVAGRFTQEDPLGGGYGYAGDNPANFTDPSGLFSDENVVVFGPPPPLEAAASSGGGGRSLSVKQERQALLNGELDRVQRDERAQRLTAKRKGQHPPAKHTKGKRPSTKGKHQKRRPGGSGKGKRRH